MKKFLIPALLILLSSFAYAHPGSGDDAYLQGYIMSMLENRFQSKTQVQVRSGEVFLLSKIAEHPEYEKIIVDISNIKNVKAIKLVDENQMRRISKVWSYPNDNLFRPLLADPRWPGFFAGYNYHTDNINFKHTMNVNLGHTFSLVNGGLGEDVYYEVGFQAGAFSMFDVGTTSYDLINVDFLLGVPVTVQLTEGVSVMARIYNQSSYIGYEFLNRKKGSTFERVDFNYKAFDLLGSFEPNEALRFYGGFGYIFKSSPGIDKWMYHAGAEYRIIADNSAIPPLFVALDIKGMQENDSVPSASVKLGADIFNNASVVFSLYDGYSPDGQFFNKKTTWAGIGFNLLL